MVISVGISRGLSLGVFIYYVGISRGHIHRSIPRCFYLFFSLVYLVVISIGLSLGVFIYFFRWYISLSYNLYFVWIYKTNHLTH